MSAWTTTPAARHRRDAGIYIGKIYFGPHVHKKNGTWGWGVRRAS